MTSDAVRYWTKIMADFTFENEQAARDEVFRICENHSAHSWNTRFSTNTVQLNRRFAEAMPLFRDGNSWKVGLKEYLSNMTSDFSDGTSGEPAMSGPDPGSINQVGLPDYKTVDRMKKKSDRLKALLQRRDPDGISKNPVDVKLRAMVGESIEQPILGYHSSPYSFKKFDTSKEGAHFGSYDQAASLRKPGKKAPKAYLLNIRNPLRMPDIGGWNHFSNVHANLHRLDVINDAEADEAWQAWNSSDDQGWETLKQILKRKGYDGIVYENEQEGPGDSYIAFWAYQIKPAPREAHEFDLFDDPEELEEAAERLKLLGIKLEVDAETGAIVMTNTATGHYFVYNDEWSSEELALNDAEMFTSQEAFEKQWEAVFGTAEEYPPPGHEEDEDDLPFD